MAQPFLESMDALDKSTRKAAREAIEKVQAGHPSVHVHKLQGSPFVSFEASGNGHRVICKREGDLLLLCHVGTHKEAYEWAERNRAVQVGKHLRIIRTELVEERVSAAEASSGTMAIAGPLSSIPDATFARIDISPRVSAFLRSVPDEDTLLDLAARFPPALGEALVSLSLGDGELDAIAAEFASKRDSSAAPTLAEAVKADANSAHIWLPSPDDDAVRKALEGGIAGWRVFLHPTQRRLVRTHAKGALKIGGGPGTGKTVVALHRARWLAEHAFASDPRPILVTTFNSTLARQLEPMLDELCSGAPDVRKRIVVLSTTRVAQELLKTAKRPNRLVTEVDDAWNAALTFDAAARGRRFYESERANVLARHGAWTEPAYLGVTRTGRTTRLDRGARKEVWKVLSAFEDALTKDGGDDIALARGATQIVAEQRLAPYAAIVCDEAQDLGAADLRLLSALARDPERDAIRDDALTLAGDAYQRLYRAPVPLSACGIDVRGRARNLRLNYRSTDAIRRAAVAVIEGTTPADADETDATTLDGYRALRRGAPPDERAFATPADEAAWIAELAKKRGEGTLLVLARTKDYLESLKALLTARGTTPRMLGANDLPADDDGLVLCTLHRAKGLEAPRVVIAGRQLVPMKYPGGGDAADRAAWDAKESAALYVGITRARDWCGVARIQSAETPK